MIGWWNLVVMHVMVIMIKRSNKPLQPLGNIFQLQGGVIVIDVLVIVLVQHSAFGSVFILGFSVFYQLDHFMRIFLLMQHHLLSLQELPHKVLPPPPLAKPLPPILQAGFCEIASKFVISFF